MDKTLTPSPWTTLMDHPKMDYLKWTTLMDYPKMDYPKSVISDYILYYTPWPPWPSAAILNNSYWIKTAANTKSADSKKFKKALEMKCRWDTQRIKYHKSMSQQLSVLLLGDFSSSV